MSRKLVEIFHLERIQFGLRVVQAEVLYSHLLDEFGCLLSSNASVKFRAQLLVDRLVRGSSGFGFSMRNRTEDFTLTGTLLNRAGNCLGLSTLLSLLANDLGVPIRPVLLEGHMVCDLATFGEHIRIELSRHGMFVSPRLAKLMYGTKCGVELSLDELFAVHLSNQAAFFLLPNGKNYEALEQLDWALKLFPNYVSGRINRATLLIQMGRVEEAALELERVIILGPGPRYRRVAKKLFGQIIANAIPSQSEASRIHW